MSSRGPTKLHQPIPPRSSDLPNLKIGETHARALVKRIDAALEKATSPQRAPLQAARVAAEKCATDCGANVVRTVALEADLVKRERALADAEFAAQKAHAREQELYLLEGAVDDADALARRDACYLAAIRVYRAERHRDALRFTLAAITDPWRTLRRLVGEAEDGNHRIGGTVHQGVVDPRPITDLAHLGYAIAYEDDAAAQFVKDEAATHKPAPVARLRDAFKLRLARSLTAIASAQADVERTALLASIRSDVHAAVLDVAPSPTLPGAA